MRRALSILLVSISFVALAFVSSSCKRAPTSTSTSVTAVKSGVATSGDGARIAYDDVGSSDVAVIFVHCWTCNRHEWDHARDALASSHRVVTLDLAGHGDSSKDRASWTMTAFGDDVRAVAEALSLKNVILVGHSMGGPVIVEAARAMKGRVRALVAIDTLSNLEAHPDAAKLQPMLDALSNDFAATSEKLMRERFGKHADPAVIDVVLKDRLAVDPKSATAMATSMFTYDAGPVVGELGLPLREINADNHPTNVEGNKKIVADFDAIILDDVGHWPMREKPKAFEDALAKVLDALAR
jgi:pimeloyl-ACP methyl ester carboxylesterase